MSEIPKYTRWFNPRITICGMDLGLATLGEYDRWGPGRDELDKENSVTQYLVHLLRRVSWIEHFRYYPIHPNCLDGTWPKWEVSESDRVSLETCFQGGLGRSKYGCPARTEGEYSWQGVQRESEWIFPKIMEAFEESHVWLESVESPLLGNRALYCAISGGSDLPRTDPFIGRDLFKWFPPTYLKRVALTVIRLTGGPFLNSDGLEDLINLEYLDIPLSKSPQEWIYGLGSFTTPFRIGPGYPSVRYRLEKLKEFQLMADHQYSFCERDIPQFLNFFPNLKKLAFGHILLANGFGNWSNLLQRLAAIKLEELWLLDPRNLVCHNIQLHRLVAHHHHHHPSQTTVPTIPGIHNTDYHMVKYVEDDRLLVAAQKVRLIDTASLWTEEGYAYPGLRRDFEYPGFAIFEQTEDDG